MDEILLLESPTLRQRFCKDQNISVLDKVSHLDTLEQTEFATFKQVCEFFQVPPQAIKSLVFDHKEELLLDGYKVFLKKELQKFLKGTFEIPNRGLALFPRRAVLRIAMLLRDSPIARNIRTYLLKVEEEFWGNLQLQEKLQGFSRQLIHQAQALVEHADQLSSHSSQLNSQSAYLKHCSEQLNGQASQLQNHSEQVNKQANQLAAQARIIAALAEEMYWNRSEIQEMKKEMKTYEKRLKSLESKPSFPKELKNTGVPKTSKNSTTQKRVKKTDQKTS
jgi:uncharacterized coiled-coil DUF342 family protein